MSDDQVHLGQVLVVDDDVAIRRVCARVLGAEGWTVTLADNGRAALAELETSNVPYDCVLSDVNMPEVDGFELVRAVRKRDDDIPVLLMVGDVFCLVGIQTAEAALMRLAAQAHVGPVALARRDSAARHCCPTASCAPGGQRRPGS